MSFDSPPVDALGRIVVVAAGFALWKDGKCVAAARWSDIRLLRAYRAEKDAHTIRLLVELADGTLLDFHEKAPGFDPFLDRASATLAGLRAFATWHPALMLAPPGGEGTIIFERPLPRR